MQAVILAAGMGKRLKDYTKNNTKCMVKVNGVTLIERMLSQLDRKNLSRIVIVVGYEGQKLIDYVKMLPVSTPINFIENDIYDKTNNIYSLYLAKDYLCEDDTLLLESDIIFEDSVLDSLIYDKRETLALVAKYESWMDGTCLKVRADDGIEDFISGSRFCFEDRAFYYKTVNLYKFSRHFSLTHYCPFLEAYTKAIGKNEYYEQVLKVITMLDDPEISARRLENHQKWYEIDDIQDLNIAEILFEEDSEKKLKKIQESYGGYWRYPEMLDYCYLVNPFFPGEKLISEMKASFTDLLTQYPSGMYINSLLASKNFDVSIDNIVVGNGAAEIIRSYMDILTGRTGFITPTFEEYCNRYDSARSVCFVPDNPDMSYTDSDIIDFYSKNRVDNLILINPDNPSGNYLNKEQLLNLITWAKEINMRLLIDESFADFADEADNTLINMDILDDNPHLCVMKSISKSYGVPGLRLGIMASSDAALIEKIKKDVSIWNLNSFAEFFMQILGKYRKDYEAAMIRFREERENFRKRLCEIPGIRPIPSQSNYFMVELTGNIRAGELTTILLDKYEILIKDLTKKVSDRYVRIAIRNREDNDRLISALKSIMN